MISEQMILENQRSMVIDQIELLNRGDRYKNKDVIGTLQARVASIDWELKVLAAHRAARESSRVRLGCGRLI
jgi:hypothetical protein